MLKTLPTEVVLPLDNLVRMQKFYNTELHLLALIARHLYGNVLLQYIFAETLTNISGVNEGRLQIQLFILIKSISYLIISTIV